MINTELLQDFMNNFFGYGNLKSDFWFIGMEEGGGNTPEEITSRLEVWERSQKPTVLDICEFHREITNDKGKNFGYLFNGVKSKYQRTWGGIIKILLNYYGDQSPGINVVKEFQSSQLGRHDSNNCLLEVFPLPSKGVNNFDYPKWTNNYLTSRTTYKAGMKELRVRRLKNLIKENKPSVVVFLSSSPEYMRYWSLISDINFDQVKFVEIEERKKQVLRAKFAQKENISFVVIHHPVYPGITNNYYKVISEKIKNIV